MNTIAETEAPLTYTTSGPPKRKSFIWRSTGSAATDTDEFLTEIEKHKDAFYRFIRRTLWDSAEADDVFSSAVLAAYENRHKYTPGSNFRAWMFRILLNKCFVANRETGRIAEPLDTVENNSVGAAKPAERWDVINDPMKILDACGDEVYRAIMKLSAAQRACIMLRGVERFSYREIATILEIPEGTVMTHLARGRAKLRQQLADYAMKLRVIPSPAGN